MTGLLERLRTGLSDRYEVERQIGEGGMATVFRAVDRKHGRTVAIKVFKPELAATMGTERFVREIELSAKLQHPHIVPLYDSGAVDGIVYYVMPFVEGESLRDRLERDKTLSYDRALPLIQEVASALSYAHDQGVVHRDIKPENILLSGGHAMVADFGIARAISAAQEGQKLTGIGFAVGTPAYMSPEQATASDVDARSDQYSLACVLYESVTGAPPFSGPTVQAVLKQSLSGARPKLSKVSRSTPSVADPIVAKALASDPADRYPSVAAFAAALADARNPGARTMKQMRVLMFLVGFFAAAWATGLVNRWLKGRARGPASGTVVAVLPFSATGAGIEPLGEGMVDLLATNLNAVGGSLKAIEPRLVLARWAKRGGGGDVAAATSLAGELGANAVIIGSMVATGSRARLAATAYDGKGGELAKAQVEGAQDSVLGLVDQLSGELVRGLWKSNEPVPSLRVSGITSASFPAMGAYLAGERYYRQARWDSAEAAFGRAIELDSTFSLAHFRLGSTIGWKGGYGSRRAREASAAAVRFVDRLPAREKAIVVAYDLFHRGLPAAADSMRGYTARYPNDVDGWFLLGEFLYHGNAVGMLDPATLREPFDRVMALDSTLAPAAIHPTELALQARDAVAVNRYVAVMEKASDGATPAAFRAAAQVVFEGRTDSATVRAAGRSPGALRSALSAVIRAPEISSDSVIRTLNGVLDLLGGAGTPDMMFARSVLYSGLGRLDIAGAVADSLRSLNQDMALSARLLPVLVGIVPDSFAAREIAAINASPRARAEVVRAQVQIAMALGEVAAATRLVDSVLARDSTAIGGFTWGLFTADRGRLQLARGDTVRAIATCVRGSAGWGPAPRFSRPRTGWNSRRPWPVEPRVGQRA
ncbi:MAG: hypothetical protein FJ206_07855 [Gemmatimonadetes bacterium]|nr:hypothetical protein [Gemmatimonadota bacterium]